MTATVQIFVYMPDEAVDTWRPVEASSLPLESIGSCHPTPIRTAKYGNSVPASSFAVRSERFKEDRLVSLPPVEPSRPTRHWSVPARWAVRTASGVAPAAQCYSLDAW